MLWWSAEGRRHIFWSVANRASQEDADWRDKWGPEEEQALRSAVGPTLLALFAKQPVELRRRSATEAPGVSRPGDVEWRAALLKRVVGAITGKTAKDPLYASVYWEGLLRITVTTPEASPDNPPASGAAAVAGPPPVRAFTLAFDCPPRGPATGTDAIGWNPAYEMERAERPRRHAKDLDSAYARQVRTLSGMPSAEASVGCARDETPLIFTETTWKDARRVRGTPMVSAAAARLIAEWRRERAAARARWAGLGVNPAEAVEPSMTAVMEALRSAAVMNGSGEVCAIDCWLLLAVPGPGGPPPRRPSEMSDAELAVGEAQRLTAWYFDAVTAGTLSAMRTASETASRRCDALSAALADAETRLGHRPDLYRAWVMAAGCKIDAQLRVVRAVAALEGIGKTALNGLRASGVAAMAPHAVWIPVISPGNDPARDGFERSLAAAVESACGAGARAVERVDAVRIQLVDAWRRAHAEGWTSLGGSQVVLADAVLHDDLPPPPTRRLLEATAQTRAVSIPAAEGEAAGMKTPPPAARKDPPFSPPMSTPGRGLLDRFAAVGAHRPGSLEVPPSPLSPGSLGQGPPLRGPVNERGGGEGRGTDEEAVGASVGSAAITATDGTVCPRSLPPRPPAQEAVSGVSSQRQPQEGTSAMPEGAHGAAPEEPRAAGGGASGARVPVKGQTEAKARTSGSATREALEAVDGAVSRSETPARGAGAVEISTVEAVSGTGAVSDVKAPGETAAVTRIAPRNAAAAERSAATIPPLTDATDATPNAPVSDAPAAVAPTNTLDTSAAPATPTTVVPAAATAPGTASKARASASPLTRQNASSASSADIEQTPQLGSNLDAQVETKTEPMVLRTNPMAAGLFDTDSANVSGASTPDRRAEGVARSPEPPDTAMPVGGMNPLYAGDAESVNGSTASPTPAKRTLMSKLAAAGETAAAKPPVSRLAAVATVVGKSAKLARRSMGKLPVNNPPAYDPKTITKRIDNVITDEQMKALSAQAGRSPRVSTAKLPVNNPPAYDAAKVTKRIDNGVSSTRLKTVSEAATVAHRALAKFAANRHATAKPAGVE